MTLTTSRPATWGADGFAGYDDTGGVHASDDDGSDGQDRRHDTEA